MTAVGGPRPERLFSLFQELVRIDSEPRSEGKMCAFLKEFFSHAGLTVHEDTGAAANGGECGNLVVRVPAGAFSPLPPVMLNAHMDSVVPSRGVFPLDIGDRFTSLGETVLGADCKAGLAVLMTCAEWLLSAGLGHRSLELVFTVQEEIGLAGAKNMDMSLVDGEWAVVLDGSGPVGGIVVEAPGQEQITFTVRGRGAHAGIEPEKGVNAIACAAKAISTLQLGRLDERTTANVGVFRGGEAVNIVPDLVTVQAEVRGHDDERLRSERDAMVLAFARAAEESGCGLETEVERSFERFRLDASSTPVRFLAPAMRKCGIEPHTTSSGGGSDANVFNRAGIPAACMCIGLANAHSKEEYILKSDMEACAKVICALAVLSASEGEG
ncbi:MAG: M20/M25/M40 family metallo-hydrolase [Actinomycetota bacterium]